MQVYSIVLENILKILRNLKNNIDLHDYHSNIELYLTKYDVVSIDNRKTDICAIKIYTFLNKHQNELYNFQSSFHRDTGTSDETSYLLPIVLSILFSSR